MKKFGYVLLMLWLITVVTETFAWHGDRDFSIVPIAIVNGIAGLFIFGVGVALASGWNSKPSTVCQDCGQVGRPKSVTRGSTAIELVLWLSFILPGLIYSLWRLSTRQHNACPVCNGKMIPLDSPKGRELAERYKTV